MTANLKMRRGKKLIHLSLFHFFDAIDYLLQLINRKNILPHMIFSKKIIEDNLYYIYFSSYKIYLFVIIV